MVITNCQDSEVDSDDEDAGIRVYAHEGPHDQDEYPKPSSTADRNGQDGQFTAGKHDEDGRRMSPQRGQLNGGGVASGQHHCFSTTQMTNEEGIQEKQSNIMTNGTQTTSLHC